MHACGALHRGIRRLISIRRRPCPQFGQDGKALLAALGSLQRDDVLGALDVPADWLNPVAVMPALPLAMRLEAAGCKCEICIDPPTPLPPHSGTYNEPTHQTTLR
ncbi:hypothetical protein CKO45_08935 [Paracraurococcus ruber]|uniref:Uncharacterized protein n=2 Tax=Paracraurococcus ruber TaxID=77675 RepID=A0ABS1CX95_9PROT|nr:hypothetical protein [Paracraurococcus ruber]